MKQTMIGLTPVPRTAAGQPLVNMAHLAEKLLPAFGMAESVRHEIVEAVRKNLE